MVQRTRLDAHPPVGRTGGSNRGRPLWGVQSGRPGQRPVPRIPEDEVSTGGQLDQAELKGYAEVIETVTAAGDSVGLDAAKANVWLVELGADSPLRPIPPSPADGKAVNLTVYIRQTSPGAVVTWDAAIAWNDGAVPQPPPLVGGVGVVSLQWVDPLGFWIGFDRGSNREVP